MAYEIVQGSNGNVLELVIRDDGKIVDLTDTSVSVVVTFKSTGVTKQATIADPINGICEITLNSSDILYEGVYSFQAQITYSDGRKFTSTIQRFSVTKKIGFIPSTGGGTGGSTEVVGGLNGHILVNGSDVKVYDDATLKADILTLKTTNTTTNNNLNTLNTDVADLKNSKHTHENISEIERIGINVNNKLTIDGVEIVGSGSTPSNVILFEDWVGGESVTIDTGGVPPADTTAPNNVTNLTTSNLTATSLTLVWTTSNSTDVTGYEVYNGANLLSTVAGNTYNVSGLTANTSYTFNVKAKDGSNNIASGTTVNVTTSSVADTTAPNNVTNLTTSNVTQTGLTLNWTASVSSDIASYDIYNGVNLLANVTGTTYNVTSLTFSTQYTFYVKAKDITGNIASGTSVIITTSAPPVDTTAPILTITPASTFTDTKTVAMSTNETATIYYTLDDTDPITSGTKLTYTAPLTLTETDTVKAYAVDSASNASAVQTVVYTKESSITPGTIIVSDTFDRADNASSLGNADTGQTWTSYKGEWGISGNQAKLQTDLANSIGVVECGLSDCEMVVRTPVYSNVNRILFRAKDNNNYLYVSNKAIYKVVNGIYSKIADFTTFVGANNDVFKVVLNGSTITVFVNDIQYLQVVETTFQTETKHGFGGNFSQYAIFDDFKVTAI